MMVGERNVRFFLGVPFCGHTCQFPASTPWGVALPKPKTPRGLGVRGSGFHTSPCSSQRVSSPVCPAGSQARQWFGRGEAKLLSFRLTRDRGGGRVSQARNRWISSGCAQPGITEHPVQTELSRTRSADFSRNNGNQDFFSFFFYYYDMHFGGECICWSWIQIKITSGARFGLWAWVCDFWSETTLLIFPFLFPPPCPTSGETVHGN